MHKKLSLGLFILLAFFAIGTALSTNTLHSIGQESDVPQLSAEAVLSILAQPLPSDSENGFYLVNINMENANLTGVHLNKAQIDFSNFINADLDNGNLSEVSASYSNFTDASFGFANLQHGVFTNSIFINTNFNGSNLSNATFADTNLTNANFSLASLDNTNFYGADLTGVNLLGATLNNTVLPDGSIYAEGDDLIGKFNTASNP